MSDTFSVYKEAYEKNQKNKQTWYQSANGKDEFVNTRLQRIYTYSKQNINQKLSQLSATEQKQVKKQKSQKHFIFKAYTVLKMFCLQPETLWLLRTGNL